MNTVLTVTDENKAPDLSGAYLLVKAPKVAEIFIALDQIQINILDKGTYLSITDTGGVYVVDETPFDKITNGNTGMDFSTANQMIEFVKKYLLQLTLNGCGDCQPNTGNVVFEKVVGEGYSKSQVDKFVTDLVNMIKGRPEPVYPAGAIFIGNAPLSINNLIITV